ncbi:hypothetical protein EG68_09887 [Paragonimus skrjabini miyazakii]|uniref:Integrase p58-like C-terminal domain-containing protein n=1 Tax=Paragonimus skrjabini miyazakii TaxID=59628 RepID=A0A8S9YT45_9TREM|nr:hypothetical protein EG68_09887 [Paragonimus skrjabini miyazakii]
MASGRELRLASDTLLPTDHHEPPLTTEHIPQMHSSLVRGHQLARSHLQAAQRHQKAYFDRRVHGTQYQPGDEVWLYDAVSPPAISSKLDKQWKGPYVIDEVLTDVTYRIKQPAIPGWSFAVHFNRLKRAITAPGGAGDSAYGQGELGQLSSADWTLDLKGTGRE